MSTQDRDALALTLCDAATESPQQEACVVCQAQADAVLAAGWLPPDAAREAAAKAWDRGWCAGSAQALGFSQPPDPHGNPYRDRRTETGQGES